MLLTLLILTCWLIFAVVEARSARKTHSLVWAEFVQLLLSAGEAGLKSATEYARALQRWTRNAIIVTLLLTLVWLGFKYLGWDGGAASCLVGISLNWLWLFIRAWPALQVVVGVSSLVPSLADAIKEEGERAARVFFYLFAPIPFLSLVPEGPSIATLGSLVLLTALLAAGSFGGLFKLPGFLSGRGFGYALVGMLLIQVVILYIPGSGLVVASWFRRVATQVLPVPRQIDPSELASTSDWMNPIDGKPNYYFSIFQEECYIYSGPGFCPRSGQKLEPVGAESKDRILQWAVASQRKLLVEGKRQREQEENDRSQSDSQDKLRAETARRESATAALTWLSPGSNKPHLQETAVIFDPETSVLVKTLLNDAFANAATSRSKWLPLSIKPEAISPAFFGQLWNGDFTALQQTDIGSRLDAICLVQVRSATRAGDSVPGLHVTQGTLVMRLVALNPLSVHAAVTYDVTAPATSIESSEREFAKKVAQGLLKQLPDLTLP